MKMVRHFYNREETEKGIRQVANPGHLGESWDKSK